MRFFTHTNFAKATTLSTGVAFGYVIRNPDKERAWERDYAFISLFRVKNSNTDLFEKRIKCLTRYLQTQRGYGYTRLVKLPEKDDVVEYINISTWYSSDLMKKGVENSFSQKMIDKLPLDNSYCSVMYKSVVDDSEYLPEV